MQLNAQKRTPKPAAPKTAPAKAPEQTKPQMDSDWGDTGWADEDKSKVSSIGMSLDIFSLANRLQQGLL